MARVVLEEDADDLADHGVLAHEHGGGAAERETDLGHLVRPDIVGLREEHNERAGRPEPERAGGRMERATKRRCE